MPLALTLTIGCDRCDNTRLQLVAEPIAPGCNAASVLTEALQEARSDGWILAQLVICSSCALLLGKAAE